MKNLNDITDMNFGEALGYLLYDQGAIASPLDVGQADIVRTPEIRADVSNDGFPEPAQNYIRYITRSGDPKPRTHDLGDTGPEELLWDVLRGVVKYREVADRVSVDDRY